MFYKIFIFCTLLLAAMADNVFDEKYSQPMSERDMTLGKWILGYIIAVLFHRFYSS